MLLSVFTATFAQKKLSKNQLLTQKLLAYDDTLSAIGRIMVNDTSETQRIQGTYTLIRTLVRALRQNKSFDFPFDSLGQHISILTTPDKKLRIFTWHLALNNGTYRYYGAVQVNNSNKLELYPLTDYGKAIELPQDSTLKPTRWYGAHYYSMLQNKGKKGIKKYYTLIGWRGKDTLTTQKVIDVMYLTKDKKIAFGAPIFKINDDITHSRMIFEFNAEASMSLKYKKELKTIVVDNTKPDKQEKYKTEKNMIIFDHISPPKKEAEGFFETYGPDFTYDGFKFKKGKWNIKEDIMITNEFMSQDKLKSGENPKKNKGLLPKE